MTFTEFKKQNRKLYRYYNKLLRKLNKNFNTNVFYLLDSFTLKLACLCDYYILKHDSVELLEQDSKVKTLTQAIVYYEQFKRLTTQYLMFYQKNILDSEEAKECLSARSQIWKAFCETVAKNLEGWFNTDADKI